MPSSPYALLGYSDRLLVLNILEREGMSLDQFVMLAMAEKAAAIETEAYLDEHARHGDRATYLWYSKYASRE